jgi:hypothetical protein
MAFLYIFLNSLAIAVIAFFELSLQMIFNFKNKYIALIVPVMAAYALMFLFNSKSGLLVYNIQMILQPVATNGISTAITWTNVIVVFAGWLALDIFLATIGFFRNRSFL